ncbi:MAG: cytochrome c [Bacteroidales bacterium]|nr:cytochrome c [Bacteroidales bacterium]
MKRISLLLVMLLAAFGWIITSCGSGPQKQTQEAETVVQDEAEAPVMTDEMAIMMARGEQIYKEKCLACHQANGHGLPNAFPTLVGSDFLLNQTVMAVSQVLNGSEKVPSPKTIKYPAPMPPQADTKEDAVAVINYVLNNFGNDGGYITLDDVAHIVIEPRDI